MLLLLSALAFAEPIPTPSAPSDPAGDPSAPAAEPAGSEAPTTTTPPVPPTETEAPPATPTPTTAHASAPVGAPPPSPPSGPTPQSTEAHRDAWEEAWRDMNPFDALSEIPPNRSWDLALQVGLSDVAYWRIGPWHDPVAPAFGARLSYGKHVGPNRYGVAGSLNLEGPLIIYSSTSIEAMGTWDRVFRKRLVGASLGAAGMMHTMLDQDVGFSLAPSAAVRLGYSQPFSRTGRRFFVVLEPKVRYVGGTAGLTGVVLVGQGRAID